MAGQVVNALVSDSLELLDALVARPTGCGAHVVGEVVVLALIHSDVSHHFVIVDSLSGIVLLLLGVGLRLSVFNSDGLLDLVGDCLLVDFMGGIS